MRKNQHVCCKGPERMQTNKNYYIMPIADGPCCIKKNIKSRSKP